MILRRLDPVILSSLLAFALITLTPFGAWTTITMTAHILVQIPLMIAIGYGIGCSLSPHLQFMMSRWNSNGIPGILLVTFTIAFWMIPRWLDASLTDLTVEWLKYGTLVGLGGVPLALSWTRMHPIARGVVKIEFLSMLFRLGWLYLISPDRFCNNYLLTDQIWLGRGMLIVGLALSITWLIPVFFGKLGHEVAAIEVIRCDIPSSSQSITRNQ